MTALIEARRLTRVLPGPVPVRLVADIDLAVMPGEFVAITGPSGSGKSSLLYLLGLLDAPTSGTVLLAGRDTAAMSGEALARLRLESIGFVFQFHFLLPEFSAVDNVLLPMRRLARLRPRAMRERALALLDGLGLAEHAGKRPDQLSGGQRQRVAVARALANDPRLVLADEPTGSLDTRSSAAVIGVLENLARGQGRAVVTVTHSPELAARADRRVPIVDGRIREEHGAPSAVTQRGTAQETTMAEKQRREAMNPGDEAPPGAAGTGENICRNCGGSGRIDGRPCEECGGSGKVVEGIGGA